MCLYHVSFAPFRYQSGRFIPQIWSVKSSEEFTREVRSWRGCDVRPWRGGVQCPWRGHLTQVLLRWVTRAYLTGTLLSSLLSGARWVQCRRLPSISGNQINAMFTSGACLHYIKVLKTAEDQTYEIIFHELTHFDVKLKKKMVIFIMGHVTFHNINPKKNSW